MCKNEEKFFGTDDYGMRGGLREEEIDILNTALTLPE
jgi:hypothetical protein